MGIIAFLKPLLALVILSAFLTTTASAALQSQTIKVNGVTRSYSLDLPNGYTSRKHYPIVIMLHGGNGNGTKIAAETNLPAYTHNSGIIAVYPNALQSAGGTQWNDGRKETNFANQDDVTFLANLADSVVSRYGRDPARVFLAGSSSGGMMTIRMMCERTQKFHGYTVAIANQPTDLVCHPSGKTNVVFYTSTTDPVMPFNGGTIVSGPQAGVGGSVASSKDTIAFWANNNACGTAVVTNPPPTVNDGTSIIYSAYQNCGLDYYQIVGGGHAWPGGTGNARFGITTQNLNGTATMLEFFKRFGL